MAGGQIAFEAERLALAQIRVDSTRTYENAVRVATEVSAHALGVERVGVWHLRGPRELELTHLYTLSNRRHSSEPRILTLADPSAYQLALYERRAIIADDVYTNPQTSELDYYYEPLGITSMLDVPFYYSGVVGGVICHEHVGRARTWSDADASLACSIADMAGVVCGQAKLLDAQERLRDATTRRLDSSRIETLAHVATAIGHELSNTLTAIQLAMLRIQSTTDPRVAELAPSLTRSVALATQLLDGLKNFGRAGGSASRLPITDVLSPLLPMLNLLTRGAATVTMELADPGVSLGLPDGDVQQILVNLVINSSNALAAAGRQGTIAITERAVGADRVELGVGDDGPGVAPEIADRLFELYATTSAHGTGVGLWLVKQIVTEVGGSIRYEPGRPGARFVIDLPRRIS